MGQEHRIETDTLPVHVPTGTTAEGASRVKEARDETSRGSHDGDMTTRLHTPCYTPCYGNAFNIPPGESFGILFARHGCGTPEARLVQKYIALRCDKDLQGWRSSHAAVRIGGPAQGPSPLIWGTNWS